jgi:hypothetical protein
MSIPDMKIDQEMNWRVIVAYLNHRPLLTYVIHGDSVDIFEGNVMIYSTIMCDFREVRRMSKSMCKEVLKMLPKSFFQPLIRTHFRLWYSFPDFATCLQRVFIIALFNDLGSSRVIFIGSLMLCQKHKIFRQSVYSNDYYECKKSDAIEYDVSMSFLTSHNSSWRGITN